MAEAVTVYAIDRYKTNGDLIVACKQLGYLQDGWIILDPTYGDEGTMWKEWHPTTLHYHDLKLDKVDFRELPYSDAFFDAIVLDGPYKLNGTPTESVDMRYGVDVKATWQERIQLICDGIDECMRVLKPKGFLLIKCMDQVSSGQNRWQTRIFADRAERNGARLVDMLHMQGGREQPRDRRQVHSRRNYSTMLITQKDATPRKKVRQ